LGQLTSTRRDSPLPAKPEADSVGNRAVVRLVEESAERQQPPALPGSLVVGSASDPAEREPDVTAATVMERLGVNPVRSNDHGCPARRLPDEVVGPEGGTASRDTEAVIQRARSSGQGLPGNLRAPMEDAFGADLSSVRVHTGPGSGGGQCSSGGPGVHPRE
jgi:Domain of unknown function (DUF4157)